MAWFRSPSTDLDERRRHAEAFVRTLPPVPETGPLTAEERAGIEAAARRCTVQGGYRRHGKVVWVRSPVEFHQLTTNTCGVLVSRGDRAARWLLPVGEFVIRMVLCLLCNLVGVVLMFAPLMLLGWVGATGTDMNMLSSSQTVVAIVFYGYIVYFFVSIVFFVLAAGQRPQWRSLRTAASRIRPLRMRMPPGVRPGTHDRAVVLEPPVWLRTERLARRHDPPALRPTSTAPTGSGEASTWSSASGSSRRTTTSRPSNEFVPVPQVRPRPRISFVSD